jgi:uncharacterized protein YggE
VLKKFALICALALVPIAALAQLPSYPFVHVTGHASVVAPPDLGTIDFLILASDVDPAAARKVIEARVAEVRALVEAQGLPLDDVDIRDVRQEIRKGDAGAGVASPVYDLRCGVHLNVRDLSKWQAIAGELLAKPNLDAFSTAFDISNREEIEAQLVTAAIADARRRAGVMVAGFGRKLGPVTAATPGALKNLSTTMGLVRADFFDRNRSSNAQTVPREQILVINSLRFEQPIDAVFRIK